MIKHKNQRIGVFVDIQNMYYSAKNLYGKKVNFQEILRAAIAERKLIRSAAYVIKAQTKEEQAFFDALSKQGFEVKMKELQIFPGGMKKGDWDVGMAVDAIKLADKLDVIVLVTGDGDFLPLVKYLQENKGCLVEIIAFGETTSGRLIDEADDFIDLSQSKSKYLLKR
ncbi:MAG: NYN domain-containing protein [Patescibacteria group bacterium]